MYVSMEEDGIQKYSVANRWRLEPKGYGCVETGKVGGAGETNRVLFG